VTDFDRDGYGLFGLRVDGHPFDAARHPLALDVPGNGIDEDGYAGDLRLVPVPQPRGETVIGAKGPNVIVVVMESTRADVLGKRIDGKLVAPNLAALAAEGSSFAPSFSHVAFTTASLKSIFAGRLEPHVGDPSLFTELKKSGYGVAVFSGQPEDFGDISETVGMRRSADVFVDAEKLKDKRAFSFAAQGSLLIDEGVLLGEFDKHLGKLEAWQRPQFVYLNFQSPHFPYDHPGVPHRFAHPPLERGAISAVNREKVERTYWNAVARADDALGELVARLKALGVWDNTIVLVTGDHGESLFEDGFLGHGHIINTRQFATFLVVNRKVEGIVPPIAISDYRDILLDLLTGETRARPPIAPFMHIGELDTPSAIGLADPSYGVISLRLDTGEACFARSSRCDSYSDLKGAERKAVDALVARWGSERWAAQRR
jgi:membrane-anchored protein YejM (alkaline phosphatase superfamily)